MPSQTILNTPWRACAVYDQDVIAQSGRVVATIGPGWTTEEVAAIRSLLIAAPDLVAMCENLVAEPAKVQEIMRHEGFVIDDLDDRWQKFAFTLYNIIVSNAVRAETVIAKAEGKME